MSDHDEPTPRTLVVTGTDTGVGKTHVTRGIVRGLVRAGIAVAPLKLLETGCRRNGARLLPDDALALARALGREDLVDTIGPERFELPAAPSAAARHVGREIRFAQLREHVARARALAPRIVLEGAGGFMVPIGPDGLFADLTQELEARVVVVARDALGTLNHTLLTVEAIARRGLEIAAVVLNAVGPEPSPLAHRDELTALLPGIPIAGPLGWQPDASDDACAAALAAHGLDAAWWRTRGFGESPA